jgi:hypothetical protein
MATVDQYFWLDNGDQSMVLTDGGISGESMGVDFQTEWCRLVVGNTEDSSPLCESSPKLSVFLKTYFKSV